METRSRAGVIVLLIAALLLGESAAETRSASIDVSAAPYYADRSGEEDSRPAIEAAMAAAKSGDELFFPAGRYSLASAWSSDPSSNIRLKSGVSLRGEDRDRIPLVTSFDDRDSISKPAGENRMFVIRGVGVKDLRISGFTVSSTWRGEYSLDAKRNNPSHGGPDVCVLLGGSASSLCECVVVEDLALEKFLNSGVEAGDGCRNVLIKGCVVRSATDVGPGGCGYGFQLSGPDNYANAIEGCSNGDRPARRRRALERNRAQFDPRRRGGSRDRPRQLGRQPFRPRQERPLQLRPRQRHLGLYTRHHRPIRDAMRDDIA